MKVGELVMVTNQSLNQAGLERTIYGKLANNKGVISNQNGGLFEVWC